MQPHLNSAVVQLWQQANGTRVKVEGTISLAGRPSQRVRHDFIVPVNWIMNGQGLWLPHTLGQTADRVEGVS